MLSNIPLLVTNIAYGFFFVLTVAFGLWVYLKSSRKLSHVMFMLLSLAIGIYQISFVLGINTHFSDASRIIFQTGLALIFVVAFTVHWIAAVVEREREYKPLIVTTYVIAGVLLALYTILPRAYLLESAPKLYFPNYYVAGDYHFLLVLFFAFGFIASLRILAKSFTTADALHRNRIAYFMTALCIAYPLGSLSFFL